MYNLCDCLNQKIKLLFVKSHFIWPSNWWLQLCKSHDSLRSKKDRKIVLDHWITRKMFEKITNINEFVFLYGWDEKTFWKVAYLSLEFVKIIWIISEFQKRWNPQFHTRPNHAEFWNNLYHLWKNEKMKFGNVSISRKKSIESLYFSISLYSPQSVFQLFATNQYFTPFSVPHPSILTACPPKSCCEWHW